MSVTGSLNTVEAGSDTLAASGSPTVSASLTPMTYQVEYWEESAPEVVTTIVGIENKYARLPNLQTATSYTWRVRAYLSENYFSDWSGSAGFTTPTQWMDSQEQGVDTLSATGELGPAPLAATLAAQEQGHDTFSAEGELSRVAVLSVQEQGNDIASAEGNVYISVVGSLARQEQGQDGFFQIYFSVELTNADTATLVGLFENVYDLEYVASGLDSGVNYTWRIKAHRDSNDGVVYESDWSQEMSFFTGDILATLAAVESENDIYVNWRIFHLIAQDVGEDALSAGASVAVEGILAASEEGSDLTPRRVSISVEESGADLLSAEMYRTLPVGAAYRARYNPLANVHDFPTALSESVSSGYAAHYDIRMYDKVGGAQVFGGANYIATAHTVDMDPGTVQVRQSFDFARAGSSAVQRPMTYSLSGTAPILQSISFVQPTNFFATRTYHAVLSSGLEQSVARAHHYAVAAQLSVDRQYLVALGTEATTRVGRSHTAAYAFSEAVAVLYHVPVISADSVSGPHIIATAAASRHTVARIYRATYSLQIGEAVIERVDWQVL